MSKRKERREKAELFVKVRGAAASHGSKGYSLEDDGTETAPEKLVVSEVFAPLANYREKQLPRMKKFRYQLLHEWIMIHIPLGRVADVGGGKGLLAYLLHESGWEATVIDPVVQGLPPKYKDLATNRQMHIPENARVPRIDEPFSPNMAEKFDVLVAMHAHGCNVEIIDAAAELGKEAVLLPCCVIGEPLIPPPGRHWIESLADYAVQKGFLVEPFRLNFKGQNIGLYLKPGEPNETRT